MNANTPITAPFSSRTGLSRRSLLIAALGVPVLAGLTAACGDQTKQSDATTADSTATTAAPAGGIEHPRGADDVIFRYGFVGGFTTPGYSFMQIPSLLVTGDGRLITPGATTMIYPGPLLPTLDERSITEAGIQKLLGLADTAGLLAPPPDYSGEILVADAPDTLVEVHANGTTYTHQAMAIGFDEPDESDARKALRTFTELIGDIVAVVGAQNLGEQAPVVAESYRIQTMPVSADELSGFDPAPTVVDWTLAEVSLAAAAECLDVPAATAGAVFADAKQDTLFRETTAAGAQVYRLAAIARLPGDTCG